MKSMFSRLKSVAYTKLITVFVASILVSMVVQTVRGQDRTVLKKRRQPMTENSPFPQKLDLVVQASHSETGVSGIAYSAEAKMIATWGLDQTVKLWSLSTGMLIRTLYEFSNYVGAVSFSPNGKSLVTGSGDALLLWDVVTGKILWRSFDLPNIKSVTFTHDGKRIISQSWDSETTIRDVSTGRALRKLSLRTSLALSPDDKIMATWAKDGIYLLETSTQTAVGHFDVDGEVESVAFSPNGKLLAMVNKEGVRIWSIEKSSLVLSIKGDFSDMAFGPDSKSLAVFGNSLKLLDIATTAELHTIELPSGIHQNSIVFCNPRGSLFACKGDDGLTTVWDPTTGAEVWKERSPVHRVEAIAISPDGKTLVSAIGHTWVWSITTGTLLRSLEDKYPTSVAFSPDGKMLAIGSETIALLDTATKAQLALLRGHTGSVKSIIISPDSRILMSRGYDKDGNGSTETISVKLWDTKTGAELPTFNNSLVAFSPDWKTAVAYTKDKVKLFDVTTGIEKRTLRGLSSPSYYSLPAFSQDGKVLATVDKNGSIILFDVATGQPLRALKGDSGFQSFSPSGGMLVFSHDGRLLASTSGHNSIKLWNVATGMELATFSDSAILDTYSYRITSIAFSPDDHILIRGSWDGNIKLWDTSSHKELATMLAFDESDWLVVTPDGLFDGTADAMQEVAWRQEITFGVANRSEVESLDSFFTDFYHPGLMAEIMAGQRPKAEFDIATIFQIPSLRTMLAHKQAHLENRNKQVVVCFDEVPGAGANVLVTERWVLPKVFNGYRIDPHDATCKYQKELPSTSTNQAALIQQLKNWKPEVITTPWDGKQSTDTTRSTLHVLTIGIGKYPSDSGYAQLPYATQSTKAIESFFRDQQSNARKPYANVRVWDGLYDGQATRNQIRKRLGDMAKVVGENDTVLLYFAGHGEVPSGKEMFYFLPVDGRSAALKQTGLNTAMMAEALHNLASSRIVLIIDACQSGGAIEALSKIGSSKARAEERRVQQEATAGRNERGIGIHLIAATLPLSYALQNVEKQSPLVEAILEALRQGSECVTVRQLMDYLAKHLAVATSKPGSVFRQVPLINSIGLDFPLAAR